MSPEAVTVKSSEAEVWYLKQITFRGRDVQIITQNYNGPCSFIAICNILILRGNIEILPPTRKTVSYEFLSQLVAEYLLKRAQESSTPVDISAALSIMPYTQRGMDLNPQLSSPTSFKPTITGSADASIAGGELQLFAQAGIHLVHGWLVDPDSAEAHAFEEEKTWDYDSAATLIAEADHLAGGMLVEGIEDERNPQAESSSASGSSSQALRSPGGWSAVERRKVKNAVVIRHFLSTTQSQLTYHGLFHLASTLPAGSLVALFRNSHLSVLYKSGEELIEELAEGRHEPGPQTSREPTPEIEPLSEGTLAESQSQSQPQPESSRPRSEDNDTLPDEPPAYTRTSAPQEQEPQPFEGSSPAPSTDAQTSSVEVQVQAGPSTISAPAAQAPAKRPTRSPSRISNGDSALYALVTDQVFLNEPSVIWERIEDVDGSGGVFVDSWFVKSSPAGGDWAGRTAEDAAREIERRERGEGVEVDGAFVSDHELARQLQAEEEHYARMHERERLDRQRLEQERMEKEQQRVLMRKREEGKKLKNKAKDCVIM